MIALGASAVAPATPQANPALGVVEASIAATGGRTALLAIHSLELDLRVVTTRIDDSERAEGPYWIDVLDGHEWRDQDHGRFRAEYTSASAQWVVSTMRVDDGENVVDGTLWHGKWQWRAKPTSADRIALGPERLLLTAASAPDLKLLPKETLWHNQQTVVGFTWRGMPAKVFIDENLHLVSRLEVKRGSPFEPLDTMLGDATYRTDFSFYRPEGGLLFPRQWTTTRDGKPFSTTTVIGYKANSAPPSAGFSPPSDAAASLQSVLTKYSDRAIPKSGDGQSNVLSKIADNVWLIEGAWNVLVVQQPKGLIVIDCPQSGGYSEKIVAGIAAQFPHVPIIGIVTTTDSLWHIAGIRPYVASGVPIVAQLAGALEG
jgi:hypothetical protein